jgi:anti-anti-sigma factor
MQDDGAFKIAQLGDGVCMVAARGELDSSTAWRLREALGAASTTGAKYLIADFGAVTYLDADALAVLSASAKHIRGSGSVLVLVTDDPWLVRLLDAGDLAGSVEVAPNTRDVVTRLRVAAGAR